MVSYLTEHKFEINAVFIRKSNINTILFIIPELIFISDKFLKTFTKSRELERLFNHTIDITFMGSSLENVNIKKLESDGFLKQY